MKKLIVFIFSIVLLDSCGSESAETVQENKYEVLIENSCGFDKDVINKKVYAFASDIDAAPIAFLTFYYFNLLLIKNL